MYGGLSTKCMEACNLSKISLHPDAVAKIWPAPVPDKRLPQLGGDVSHALAPTADADSGAGLQGGNADSNPPPNGDAAPAPPENGDPTIESNPCITVDPLISASGFLHLP